MDRYNRLVSVYMGYSGSLSALLSGGIYRERFSRRYFPKVSSKDIIAKFNYLSRASADEILSLSLYNNLANRVYTYIIRKDINNRVIIL